MELLRFLLGEGKDLAIHQMCIRGIVIFLVALVLIRISGRRSFGIRTPLDNIIVILLGALLSRAVVGASPLGATVLTSLAIVIMHRMFGWLIVHSKFWGRVVEGEKIRLYQNGEFLTKKMNRGLVSKEDIMQGVRKTALTEDENKIRAIYMERNGEISVIKKEDGDD